MSIVTTFTNDTVTETWAASNQSDAWATVVADGGAITRLLGNPSVETQTTQTYTSDGTVQTIHMGTWVTPDCPEIKVLPSGCSFGFNHACGFESAGQLNANLYFKVSIVTVAGSVMSYSRTLTDWTAIEEGGTIRELGLNAGSDYPMGRAVLTGVNTHAYTTVLDTLQLGERIAIEIGISTAGRNGDTVNFEFGSHSTHEDDATIVAGQIGAGSYGSEIVVPINFTEANQGIWNTHSEILIPWVVGTDTIAWADVGTDWTIAKWVTTGAKRYVNRLGGEVTSQMWIFQDDDYLYVALNNIIDGCIQPSDHHRVFLCAGNDWQDELETDPLDWQFNRDITSGTSLSRTPTLPVAIGDGDDQGEYVLQGDAASTYPEQWEVPTFTATPNTCTFANAKAWVDGVDWRTGGPGATATAPNPNGNSSGAYSEFKIKKATLNNWNGTDHLGFMAVLQCDVQGNGTTMFPSILGNQIDKADWPWAGANYLPADQKTASSKISLDQMDLRVLMSVHAHAPEAAGDLLIVNDSSHSHTVDNVALIQSNTLVVAESVHSHTVDNVVLSQANTLIAAETLHGHTVDSIIIEYHALLIVAEALHGHTVDSVALIQSNTLSVEDGVHTHTVDNIDLTQSNTLVIAEALHGHLSDNLVLTQTNILVAFDTLHSHTVDSINLAQSNLLVAADSLHNHTVDSVALVQHNELVVEDTLHNHTADNIVFSVSITIIVQESLHSHTVDNIDLVQNNILITEEALHSHTVDSVNLVQSNLLITNNSLHSHSVDSVDLLQSNVLTVAEASHVHTVDNITLTQVNTLVVNDTLHAHIVDNIVLITADVLIVEGALHSHVVDNTNLIQSNILIVSDNLHSHIADSVILAQSNVLITFDTIHNQFADNTVIVQHNVLTAEDTLHTHIVDSITLEIAKLLVVQDSLHEHSADTVDLIQNNILVAQEALHTHTVDNLFLGARITLEADSSVHGHTSDNLVVTFLILKFLNMIGKFPTGSTVSIDIYDLADDSVVISAGNVTEVLSTGKFKYELSGITEPHKEFLFIMSNGLETQSGKLIFREDLIGVVENFIVETWSKGEKDANLAYSKKASDNAEQANLKL